MKAYVIDLEDMITTVCKVMCYHVPCRKEDRCVKIKEVFEQIKTEDVRPVVHGKWIVLDDCSNRGIYCSACNRKIFDFTHAPKKKQSRFCPSCGAQMED
jgi:hypothetical protein